MVSMDDALAKNFLGEYSMTVRKLVCTTLARPRSRLGLESVEKSVKEKGWLAQFAPSVVISREDLPTGGLTPSLALSISARVLDGNHRVVVFRKLYGADKALKVRVYLEFADAADEKVIANCESNETYWCVMLDIITMRSRNATFRYISTEFLFLMLCFCFINSAFLEQRGGETLIAALHDGLVLKCNCLSLSSLCSSSFSRL